MDGDVKTHDARARYAFYAWKTAGGNLSMPIELVYVFSVQGVIFRPETDFR